MTNTSDNRGVGRARSLHDAIRRVRTAEAERSDVVVELRDAERARLEMLADELKTIFAEIGEGNESLIFSIAGGTLPRLWIDMTSFVVMDRDRRTYRFLKDTRLGRTVLLETANLNDMADVVTNYVAERIIERERAMEGDWLIRRARHDATKRRPTRVGSTMAAVSKRHTQRPVGWIVAALLAGLLIGVICLIGYWVTVPT